MLCPHLAVFSLVSWYAVDMYSGISGKPLLDQSWTTKKATLKDSDYENNMNSKQTLAEIILFGLNSISVLPETNIGPCDIYLNMHDFSRTSPNVNVMKRTIHLINKYHILEKKCSIDVLWHWLCAYYVHFKHLWCNKPFYQERTMNHLIC